MKIEGDTAETIAPILKMALASASLTEEYIAKVAEMIVSDCAEEPDERQQVADEIRNFVAVTVDVFDAGRDFTTEDAAAVLQGLMESAIEAKRRPQQ